MAAQTVTKVQYENNVTVIGAENLNAIQDAVNNHASLIDGLDNDKVDKVAGKGLSTNDFNNDAQSKLNNLPTGAQIDTSLGQKVDKRTSGTEVYTHTGSTQGGAALTETPTAGAVPLYGTGGVLKAAAPVADNDVVRKAELDEVKDNLDAAFVVNTASGTIASFADGADGVPMRSLVVNIEAVQTGTGDPSPENIRPIAGWTMSEIQKCGKNFFADKVAVNEIYEFSGGSIRKTEDGLIASITSEITKNTLLAYNVSLSNFGRSATQNNQKKTLPNGEYRVVFSDDSPSNITVQICKSNIAGTSSISATTIDRNGTFTIDDSYAYNWIRLLIAPDCPVGEYAIKPMILRPTESDLTYEPYTGTDITADWSSVAGTVYGGTLTINPDRTGTLVVDKEIGTVGPSGTDSKYKFSTEPISVYPDTYVYRNYVAGALVPPKNADEVTDIICTHLPSISRAYASTRGENIGVFQYHNGDNNEVRFAFQRTEEFSSLTNLNTWLQSQIDAGTQMAICIPLKTTTTYTLTSEQITGILTTLLGNNNVWADCGDTEVTYCADTKLYIQQLTQPTEDDMTADHAISAGTFFMLNNQLYLATSQIAAGGTITPGTNATKLSLADALNSLNS